ncbi:MAG TPA: hypothetical protein VE135_09020 [Pyrinomonadaceae bacterium]|nr:hypothetical protein [Pyrinomonadaceae bacterium]
MFAPSAANGGGAQPRWNGKGAMAMPDGGSGSIHSVFFGNIGRWTRGMPDYGGNYTSWGRV